MKGVWLREAPAQPNPGGVYVCRDETIILRLRLSSWANSGMFMGALGINPLSDLSQVSSLTRDLPLWPPRHPLEEDLVFRSFWWP